MNKNIYFFIFFLFVINCNGQTNKTVINLNNFPYGKWKMTGYTNYKSPMMSKEKVDKMIKENQNLHYERNYFYFDSYALNNPEYRILNIGFEKKSNFINHKTSYGFGFLLNRKHMNVLQVLSNNNLCYEFEIIDDNKLLMLYAGYLLFIEKENN